MTERTMSIIEIPDNIEQWALKTYNGFGGKRYCFTDTNSGYFGTGESPNVAVRDFIENGVKNYKDEYESGES